MQMPKASTFHCTGTYIDVIHTEQNQKESLNKLKGSESLWKAILATLTAMVRFRLKYKI